MRRTTLAVIGLASLLAVVAFAGRIRDSSREEVEVAGKVNSVERSVGVLDDAELLNVATHQSPPIWANASRLKTIRNDAIFVGDLPLAPRLEDLRRRALGGDAEAALEMNIELERCSRLPQMLVDAANVVSTDGGALDEQSEEFRNQAAEGLLAEVDKVQRICLGISSEEVDGRFRWLELAAQHGNVRAVLKYVDKGSPVLESAEAMLRDPEELVRFKNNARQLLQRSARDCNVEAMSAIGRAYMQGVLFDQNQLLGNAFGVAAERLEATLPSEFPSAQRDLGGLPADQRDRVERLANAIFYRYCE